jgi:hypothetical protein
MNDAHCGVLYALCAAAKPEARAVVVSFGGKFSGTSSGEALKYSLEMYRCLTSDDASSTGTPPEKRQ